MDQLSGYEIGGGGGGMRGCHAAHTKAGRAAVRALVEAGFLIRPKSVLDPVQLVSFLGKALNLATRTVTCNTQALLQLSVGWMRLALGEGDGRHLHSYLGLLN